MSGEAAVDWGGGVRCSEDERLGVDERAAGQWKSVNGLSFLTITGLAMWYVILQIKIADCSIWISLPHDKPGEALVML